MHNPPMMSPRLGYLAAVAAAAVLAAGCGGSSYDKQDESWAFISANITEPSCATVNCHSAITAQGHVDLSGREIGYQTLVKNSGGYAYYVYPYYPQYSQLINLLDAVGSTRMPPDNPLPPADIQLIENWISAGANDN
jgi:hypothetical protein